MLLFPFSQKLMLFGVFLNCPKGFAQVYGIFTGWLKKEGRLRPFVRPLFFVKLHGWALKIPVGKGIFLTWYLIWKVFRGFLISLNIANSFFQFIQKFRLLLYRLGLSFYNKKVFLIVNIKRSSFFYDWPKIYFLLFYQLELSLLSSVNSWVWRWKYIHSQRFLLFLSAFWKFFLFLFLFRLAEGNFFI